MTTGHSKRIVRSIVLTAALGFLLVLGWAFVISGVAMMLCGASQCGLNKMFIGTVIAIIGSWLTHPGGIAMSRKKRVKKRVRKPGMVRRGLEKFVAFLSAQLYFCPHGWGRFCPKCRLWTARQVFKKAGLQWIVKARNGQSVQPFMDGLERAMRIEDVELFKKLEDDVLETEAEETEGEESPEFIAPEPRPETAKGTCPSCDAPTQGGVCQACGHYEGEEVPYEPPRKSEPED
jgi:hypothetical protein